jgi:peptidoglycan hydrolase CwlO-like protein
VGADVRRVTSLPGAALRRAVPRSAAMLLAAAVLVAGTSTPRADADAESAAQAREAAHQAAQEVADLQPRVAGALRAYEAALAGIADNVTASVRADAQADAATRAAEQRRREAGGRVRALYISGGGLALYASVLDARSAADALRRVAYIQRLVQTGASAARQSAGTSTLVRARADRLERSADAQVTTAAEVSRRYEELQALLAKAGASLARLSTRAHALEEAEAAAARLRALAAAASRAAVSRVAGAKAMAMPPAFKRLYVAAARTCRGLSWTVLAAIGQVESGHGRNPGTSYAGAQGPMQFMPATWAAYGVDGDHDGDTDINDPVDSIFGAAHYLCANGAGRGGEALRRAIWHYNHAEWYVQLVLKIAGQLATDSGGSDGRR